MERERRGGEGKKGRGKGGKGKGMEGKNVLPHVKQAVAAYVEGSGLGSDEGVLSEVKGSTPPRRFV